MKTLIRYFAHRHLLTNLVLFGVILASIGFWHKLGKEEYPDLTMPWVRFSIPYPGASAEDVELFVTKPIEEKLKELTGLYEITATSSYGSASFRIRLETDLTDMEEVIRDVKDAVDRTELPSETEDPVFRRFNLSQKAIIDIGIYHKEKTLLDTDSRKELQRYALAFKNRIITLPEISGLDDQGYLQPELQILINPHKLERLDISLNEVRKQIIAQNVRMPAGSMEDRVESEISFLSELDTVDSLEKIVVRGGLEGQKIRLKEIAHVQEGFEKNQRVLKIQGHEGVLFNVKKSASTDILTAQKAVLRFVSEFKASHPEAPIDIVLIDDESYSIRNRLSIIGWNGLLGFFLIIFVLILFLDFKSSVWVAAGLPFTLAFTLLAALIIGYTVNNITLAGIIIVLGIVVDDAIIVAENISRLRRNGSSMTEAVVEGTSAVMQPVLASVLTTCAAFIPLYFFEGHFARFVFCIPAIVFLMLGASLLEAFFILPGHLFHDYFSVGLIQRIFRKQQTEKTGHWFFLLERRYAGFLKQALHYRILICIGFVGVLVAAFTLYNKQMKFVMFPREESKEISIRAKGQLGMTRYEMAELTQSLEKIFLDEKDIVISVLTFIGQSRRGGEVREDEANLRVELVPPSQRAVPLNDLLSKWEDKAKGLKGFSEIRFMRSRWGAESGSPIEFEVQENDDKTRRQVVGQAKALLEKHPAISNVEIERPVTRNEYRLHLRGDDLFLMGINPTEVAQSLRAFVEGQILYKINKGNEEVDVRLTSQPKDKKTIDSILNLRTANGEGYLVPYRSLVRLEKSRSPSNIQRINYRRTTKIYADLKEGSSKTPLEIAEFLENEVFPKLQRGNPNTLFQFRGEIEHSRESQSDFGLAVILSLSLIYFLLVLLYDSLILPLLLSVAIPFGAVGVILAFYGHGMVQYGFFAVIGALGMIGVVINDGVVMVSRLEKSKEKPNDFNHLLGTISDISATRLRAVVVTTLTTVAGLFPTAYGWFGYDSMLSEMMLAMGWGLIFGTMITLLLIPCLYSFYAQFMWKRSLDS
jgi:multidrug efflux pump subunit AcrB